MGYYCHCGDYFPKNKLDAYMYDLEIPWQKVKHRMRRVSKFSKKRK